MTLDEMKSLVLSEDLDISAKADAILEDYSKRLYEIEDLTARNEKLSETVDRLTDTNLKLLDKVKYADIDGMDKLDTDDNDEVVTIEDLFKDED